MVLLRMAMLLFRRKSEMVMNNILKRICAYCRHHNAFKRLGIYIDEFVIVETIYEIYVLFELVQRE